MLLAFASCSDVDCNEDPTSETCLVSSEAQDSSDSSALLQSAVNIHQQALKAQAMEDDAAEAVGPSDDVSELELEEGESKRGKTGKGGGRRPRPASRPQASSRPQPSTRPYPSSGAR